MPPVRNPAPQPTASLNSVMMLLPKGRAKAFSTHCPADSPDQETRSQTHRYHGEAWSWSPWIAA